MRISGINQYTHDEVYLSYLQVLPNYTHIKKRKVLDIDVRHIVILDSGYIKKTPYLEIHLDGDIVSQSEIPTVLHGQNRCLYSYIKSHHIRFLKRKNTTKP